MRELAPLWEGVPDLPPEDWRFSASWMFVHADAKVYYALLRKWKPVHLVEVGSGYTAIPRPWPLICHVPIVARAGERGTAMASTCMA